MAKDTDGSAWYVPGQIMILCTVHVYVQHVTLVALRLSRDTLWGLVNTHTSYVVGWCAPFDTGSTWVQRTLSGQLSGRCYYVLLRNPPAVNVSSSAAGMSYYITLCNMFSLTLASKLLLSTCPLAKLLILECKLKSCMGLGYIGWPLNNTLLQKIFPVFMINYTTFTHAIHHCCCAGQLNHWYISWSPCIPPLFMYTCSSNSTFLIMLTTLSHRSLQNTGHFSTSRLCTPHLCATFEPWPVLMYSVL